MGVKTLVEDPRCYNPEQFCSNRRTWLYKPSYISSLNHCILCKTNLYDFSYLKLRPKKALPVGIYLFKVDNGNVKSVQS